MALDSFTAKKVNPGEPLTAQAWNELIDGINGVRKYLQEVSLHLVKVQVTNSDIPDRRDVRVVAVAGDVVIEAARPVTPDGKHVLIGLEGGKSYQVVASAAGFGDGTATVNVDAAPGWTTDLTVALPAGTGAMPDLIGRKLSDARAALTGKPIKVTLDSHGKEVTSALSPQYDALPVLGQSPPPGAGIPTVGVTLVVAAPSVQMVTVPNIVNKTFTQAKAALEAVGLIIDFET